MANSILDDVRNNFRTADTLTRLIYTNIGVYLVLLVANSFAKLFTGNNGDLILNYATDWLALPGDPAMLLTRPWTLITYMFLHFEFLHILFNLLWLYWMGNILREFLGNKKVLSTYILGGICGAVVYIVAINAFPLFRNSGMHGPMLGASAGVMAITVAAATLAPNYPIRLILIGTIPLKYIAFFSVLLDLVSMGNLDNVAHFAHLGGAIYGFIYIRQLQGGNDLAGWFNNLVDKLTASKPSTRSRMKVKHRRAVSDEDYVASKKSQQERIDEILDKISKSGYGSLTQDEKDTLFKSSKEN